MNDWTANQIRELVGGEIIAERRLRDALRIEDRRWIERELLSLSKALDLYSAENERRLQILNHAHEEARRVLGTYLTRELYDRAHTEVTEWQRKADIRNVEIDARLKKVELGLVDLPGGVKSLELGLAAQSAQRIGSKMTMTSAIALIGLAVVVAGAVIGFLNYLK